MKGEQKELREQVREMLEGLIEDWQWKDNFNQDKCFDKRTDQLLSLFTQYALSCLPEEKVICRDYQESSTYEAGIEEGHNQCRLITKENIERR